MREKLRTLRHLTYYEVVGEDGLTRYQRDLCQSFHPTKALRRRMPMNVGDKVEIIANNVANDTDLYIGRCGEILDIDDPVNGPLEIEVLIEPDTPDITNPVWFKRDELRVTGQGVTEPPTCPICEAGKTCPGCGYEKD